MKYQIAIRLRDLCRRFFPLLSGVLLVAVTEMRVGDHNERQLLEFLSVRLQTSWQNAKDPVPAMTVARNAPRDCL